MKHTGAAGWLAVVAAGAIGLGCLSGPAGRIEVPSDIMRSAGEGNNQRNRYVVRMTDGDRDISFELPEIATAYEVRVPLRGMPSNGGGVAVEQPTLTAADKEIVGQREVDARVRAEEPAGAGDDEAGGVRPAGLRSRAGAGAGSSAGADGVTPTPRASYLLTLAKVKDLYRSRNYEIALVELVALEREYPNDERILSMKGSLYEKVGRRQLARESWEAVLAINPYNLQVAEALQRLGK
jgi:hypothetical protein